MRAAAAPWDLRPRRPRHHPRAERSSPSTTPWWRDAVVVRTAPDGDAGPARPTEAVAVRGGLGRPRAVARLERRGPRRRRAVADPPRGGPAPGPAVADGDRTAELRLEWTELTGRQVGIGWDAAGGLYSRSCADDVRWPLAPADVLLADGSIAVVRPLQPRRRPRRCTSCTSGCPTRRSGCGSSPSPGTPRTLRRPRARPPRARSPWSPSVTGGSSASATAEPIDPDAREVAFLVADDARGQGVGTLLLEHLAALARDHGVTAVRGRRPAENHAMLERLRRRRLRASAAPRRWAPSCVELTPTRRRRSSGAADQREFRAEARSLAPLLAPAVGRRGRRPLATAPASAPRCCARSRPAASPAASSPCTPGPTRLAGVPAYPSARSTCPDRVDLVGHLPCRPRRSLDDCSRTPADAGVRGRGVVSSGFGELGAEGADLQRELVATGPRPRHPAGRPELPRAAQQRPRRPPQRHLQRRGAARRRAGRRQPVRRRRASCCMDLARELGLGVRTFVSLGNKADVSSNDLLAAWYDDPEVTAAALYLESFGNAAQVRPVRPAVRRAQAAARRGRRTLGRRAAGPAPRTPPRRPRPAVGRRRAVRPGRRDRVPRRRGPGADRAAAHRAAAARGPPGRRSCPTPAAWACWPPTPPTSGPRGPRVLRGPAGADRRPGARHDRHQQPGRRRRRRAARASWRDLVDAVLASGEVDARARACWWPPASPTARTVPRAARGPGPQHPGVPVLVRAARRAPGAEPSDAPITTYRTTASARARARPGGAVRRVAGRDRTRPRSRTRPGRRRRGPRAAPASCWRTSGRDGWLSAAEAAALLAGYGIAPLGCDRSLGAEAPPRPRGGLGFPVAMKVADPDVVHKTDRGLVRVGLRTRRRRCATAYRDFARELGRAPRRCWCSPWSPASRSRSAWCATRRSARW